MPIPYTNIRSVKPKIITGIFTLIKPGEIVYFDNHPDCIFRLINILIICSNPDNFLIIDLLVNKHSQFIRPIRGEFFKCPNFDDETLVNLIRQCPSQFQSIDTATITPNQSIRLKVANISDKECEFKHKFYGITPDE